MLCIKKNYKRADILYLARERDVYVYIMNTLFRVNYKN